MTQHRVFMMRQVYHQFMAEPGPSPNAIGIGSIVGDTYVIDALLGQGGMGAVYRASHRRLPGKFVAIKVLHAEVAGAEVMQRFRREAEIASRLGHPNIVTVHDFNVLPDGTPYLVLEYLEGQSLRDALVARGTFSLEDTIAVMRQVASGLDAAHAQAVVHRDLKPDNLFLIATQVGGHQLTQVKILDFGISKIRGRDTVQTQESSLMGTPQYMAPEQALGRHSIADARTDLFAVGAIAYEMLSGVPPFAGDSIPELMYNIVYNEPAPLRQYRPDLPEFVERTIHKAMAKDQAARFERVSEFVEALAGEAHNARQFATASLSRPIPAFKPDEATTTGGNASIQTDNSVAATIAAVGAHPSVVSPTPAKGPKWMWISVVVAALSAGGYAAWRQVNGRHNMQRQADIASRPIEPPSYVPPQPVTARVPIDAPMQIGAPAPMDAPAPFTAATTPARPSNSVPTDPARASVKRESDSPSAVAPNSKIAEIVTQMETAYAAGNKGLARSLAMKIIDAGGKTKSEGILIRGLLACDEKNIGEAVTQFGRLNAPSAKRKMCQACNGVVALKGCNEIRQRR